VLELSGGPPSGIDASMRDIEMIGTDTNLDRLSHEPSAAPCVP
jgi:hypothetical protein